MTYKQYFGVGMFLFSNLRKIVCGRRKKYDGEMYKCRSVLDDVVWSSIDAFPEQFVS